MRADQIGALIRMLGSANDHEVLAAARALVKELASVGKDLDALAAAWAEAVEQQPTPTKAKPLDYGMVESAVELYAQGKNKVTFNEVWKAICHDVADVRALDEAPTRDAMKQKQTVTRYMLARLRWLGFKASPSGKTFFR